MLAVLVALLILMALGACDARTPAGLGADGGVAPSSVASGTPSSALGSAPPAANEFAGTVEPIPPAMAAEMTGVSWRPGCPVVLADLRLVRLTYFGFDGVTHRGELMTHKDVAPAIVRVFRHLYAARFPIRKMVRIDAYGGSDDASMADDNTSMFNCRKAWGSTKWSVHAYGKAIDVNTVENPYLPGKQVLPSAGASYVDRGNVRPGMVVSGDVVVRAFQAEGFRWGGNWKSGTDYQHFETGP